MDLGKQMKTPGTEPASPVSAKEPKITYPSLSFSDDVADNFLKECDCGLGDTVTATVKLKVVGLRKDEYGNSVSFDVLSLDDIQDSDYGDDKSGDESDNGAEEKILGYKRPQVKKEAPSLSAKDLMD